MRIIAGHARGRRLVAPRGRATRPTTDRVREAIFSMVGTRMDLDGARVLDLFAGTGAMGCEALSRGAATAAFIDDSREADKAIRENLRLVGGRGIVLSGKVQRLLPTLEGPDGFDLVFMDPPYGDHVIAETLRCLLGHRLLGAEAIVVAEHGRDEPLPEESELATLTLLTSRRYGETLVTLWQTAEAPTEEVP